MSLSTRSRQGGGGGGGASKNLAKKVTFVLESGVAPTETVRENEILEESFKIVHINDFTQASIRSDVTKFENGGNIEIMSICPGSHGGLLDFPKVTSKCTGVVVQKWDHCYNEVMAQLEESGSPKL